MRRTAVTLAGLAGAMAGEAVFRYLEPTLPTHGLWYDTLPAIRIQQMRELGRADVVFAGHSMVHSGIQPRVVLDAAGRPDLSGYNAGLHRGFYGVTGPFLLDAVLPMLRPTTVVLGVSIFDLNDNGELLRDTTERYERALLGRQDAVGRAARRVAGRSALFRNHGALRRPRRVAIALAARVAGRDVADNDVRDSRHNVGAQGEWLGYSARGFHTTEKMRAHLVEGGLGDHHVGGRQVAEVEGWIRRVQDRGPQVVLALMRPSDQLWRELPDGERHREEAVATIRALAARMGVVLLEPAVDLVDEEHYADLAHLNRAGMQRFSASLGERLGAAVSAGSISLPSGRSRRAP